MGAGPATRRTSRRFCGSKPDSGRVSRGGTAFGGLRPTGRKCSCQVRVGSVRRRRRGRARSNRKLRSGTNDCRLVRHRRTGGTKAPFPPNLAWIWNGFDIRSAGAHRSRPFTGRGLPPSRNGCQANASLRGALSYFSRFVPGRIEAVLRTWGPTPRPNPLDPFR